MDLRPQPEFAVILGLALLSHACLDALSDCILSLGLEFFAPSRISASGFSGRPLGVWRAAACGVNCSEAVVVVLPALVLGRMGRSRSHYAAPPFSVTITRATLLEFRRSRPTARFELQPPRRRAADAVVGIRRRCPRRFPKSSLRHLSAALSRRQSRQAGEIAFVIGSREGQDERTVVECRADDRSAEAGAASSIVSRRLFPMAARGSSAGADIPAGATRRMAAVFD